MLSPPSRSSYAFSSPVNANQAESSRYKVWIHLERFPILFHCLVVLARVIVSHPQVRADDGRERIELLRSFHFGNCFVQPAHGSQVAEGIPVMRTCIARLQL